VSTTARKKLILNASAYYQDGTDKDGNSLSAYLLSAYSLYAATNKWSIGPGIDITSGNSTTGGINRQFDPLYGTPHKFWGAMDYFYVADGFGKNGVMDYYLKTRYKASDKLLFSLDAHQFRSYNQIVKSDGQELNPNFGTELDFSANYALTKIIQIEAGYSSFFATPTLASETVKNVSNAGLQANWAFVMLSIKPDFLGK
jgi:hypothetical protein